MTRQTVAGRHYRTCNYRGDRRYMVDEKKLVGVDKTRMWMPVGAEYDETTNNTIVEFRWVSPDEIERMIAARAEEIENGR